MRVRCIDPGENNGLTLGMEYDVTASPPRRYDPEPGYILEDGSFVYQRRFVTVGGGDPINRPPHYTSHPSGIECIDVIEVMPFNLGAAVKYIWRAGLKSPDAITDLKKSVWFLNREIARLEKSK